MAIADGKWTLVEGTTDRYVFLLRWRDMPEHFERGTFGERVNIFWNMSAPDENGLASAAEAQELERFEDRLALAIEEPEHGILLAVLTGNGQREFVFQVRERALLRDVLHAMPQETQPYPIEIYAHSDPGWDYFESLK